MPRVQMGYSLDETPISVTCVAQRLGVASSTLRTWERRYGLGPSARTIGSHRRYTALDIARLQFMKQLIEKGLSACDAAHQVRLASPDELDVKYRVSVSVPVLMNACVNKDRHLLRTLIRQSIGEVGLLKTWQNYLCPVLKALDGQAAPAMVDVLPQQLLRAEIIQTISTLLENAPPCPEQGLRVGVVSSLEDSCGAAVLGAALKWESLCPEQLAPATAFINESVSQYISSNPPKIVVLVAPSSALMEAVIGATKDASLSIVVLAGLESEEVPPMFTVLHSIPAVVAEVSALSEKYR